MIPVSHGMIPSLGGPGPGLSCPGWQEDGSWVWQIRAHSLVWISETRRAWADGRACKPTLRQYECAGAALQQIQTASTRDRDCQSERGGGSTWLSGHDVFPDVFELHFCTGTVPRGPAPRTNVAQLERLATPPEKTRPCSGPTAMCGMGWVEAGGSPALRTLRNSACGGQRNSADQTASVLWIVLGQSPI
jgi:hypothetical protein